MVGMDFVGALFSPLAADHVVYRKLRRLMNYERLKSGDLLVTRKADGTVEVANCAGVILNCKDGWCWSLHPDIWQFIDRVIFFDEVGSRTTYWEFPPRRLRRV